MGINMRVSISILDAEKWFGGDHSAVVDLVAMADKKGIDQVTVVDHVIMGANTQDYPYGSFPGTSDYPWLEPMVQLGAYASATKNIKLATGIIVSPLRPAVLLAKQISTLDALSRGRCEIGLGVGWQKEEYEACAVPWDGRFEHLMEQVKICRLLWREAPASFKGTYASFDNIWCIPQPLRKTVPIYFGLAPMQKNIDRIAEFGDGWLPMEQDPQKLVEPIDAIRRAYEKRGRDPSSLEVRASFKLVAGSDGTDWEATFAQLPAMKAAGVTTIRIPVGLYCRGPRDYERLLERVLQFGESSPEATM